MQDEVAMLVDKESEEASWTRIDGCHSSTDPLAKRSRPVDSHSSWPRQIIVEDYIYLLNDRFNRSHVVLASE